MSDRNTTSPAGREGMRTLACMCKYKVIMREPLGLSTKPGCADGRKAQLAGPQAVIAHVAAQIRAATAEAARER